MDFLDQFVCKFRFSLYENTSAHKFGRKTIKKLLRNEFTLKKPFPFGSAQQHTAAENEVEDVAKKHTHQKQKQQKNTWSKNPHQELDP